MLKKGAIVGAMVLLLIALFTLSPSIRSHARTLWGNVEQSVKQSLPVEYELERARHMIRDLDPEIERAMHEIAKAEVKVERLESQISGEEAKLTVAKDDILTLKGDLDSGKTNFVYSGREYTAKAVEEDLQRRFTNYKTKEGAVEKLQQVLNAQRNGLQAAQEELEAMLAAKKELEIKVEELEAQHKLNQVAKTTAELKIDNSRLASTREFIDELKTRIEVDAKLSNADTKFHEEIPVRETQPTGNVSDEIADYFGTPDVKEFVGSGK